MAFLLETVKYYLGKDAEDPSKRQEDFEARLAKNEGKRDKQRIYTNVDAFKPATMYAASKVHPMYEHWAQILGHQPNKRRNQQ